MFANYSTAPSESKERKILEFVSSIDKLSPNLKSKARDLLQNLKQRDDNYDLSAIYGIRTSVESFKDDGEKQNVKLYMQFKNLLSDEEKKILQETSEINKDYIKELKKLKVRLIDDLYPYKSYRVSKPKDEILKFKEEVENELKNDTTQDKINSVLAKYANNIQSNPLLLKDVLSAYSFVYAATTGQSLGKDIAEIKKKRKAKDEDWGEDLHYKAVIVDEAARVAPMDLLIVMVQAKEKIILVGDHRQLPHIYDEAFLDSSFNEDEARLIEISAFEYLVERAKKLESIDNKRRFITLNNQYRMHPLLGNFINENFYEKHGEGFNSPLKADIFAHNLKGVENLPCVCIDVPNFEHKRSASGSSYRESEIDAIDRYLSMWNNENLSCGVISFYSEQVKLLNERLRIYKDKFKNFKIGSVDSFQGMEFDIVFLSAVRSVSNPQSERDFGFLVSKNRLCVSMSRQKKILIFVGNLAFYQSDLAKKYASEISNFITLCENNGKILR